MPGAITIRLTGGPAHGTVLTVPAEQWELEVPALPDHPRAMWAAMEPQEIVPVERHRYRRAHPWPSGEPIPFHHTDLLNRREGER